MALMVDATRPLKRKSPAYSGGEQAGPSCWCRGRCSSPAFCAAHSPRNSPSRAIR